MHLKNFLKNWIKANNVFLMLKQGNSMQKLTLSQSNITVRLRSVLFKCFTDGKKYNNKYPHLAFELCNIFGVKASFASDNYFFLLVDLHCTSVKKNFFCIKSEATFIVNFQNDFRFFLLKFTLTASLDIHYQNSRINVLYKFC